MPNLLPQIFIALGAIALCATLFFLWQSVREALTPDGGTALGREVVSRERAALLSEKQSLLIALRDLEAEREAGKLSSDDFSELSGRYRARARDVLRALDEQLSPHRGAAKALLERALVSVQQEPASTVSVSVPVSVPAAPAPAPAPASAAVCACGASNDVDAVFCKKCGARLRAEQGA